MRGVLGILRLAIVFPAILITALLVLLTSWIPLTRNGARLSAWFTTWTARLAMTLFNVRYQCPNREVFEKHNGFIFANHISYFDILMLQAIRPLRWLSAEENRKMPVIGWVAEAIGTVFVNRSKRESRAQAREQLVRVKKHPPIVLFPEGGVGPANSLQSFRYGAFEIAMEGRTPYLLAAIRYSHGEVIVWGQNEGFLETLSRLARFPGPIQAEVVALKVITPEPTADPKQLATEAHHILAEAINVPPQME
jgi:1-acyl-sn-glycerol-3-phosphate acyltransferase